MYRLGAAQQRGQFVPRVLGRKPCYHTFTAKATSDFRLYASLRFRVAVLNAAPSVAIALRDSSATGFT